MQNEASRARDLLETAADIAVVSHERPDVDGLGSMLALTLGLEHLGKPVIPVLADGVPARFRFLPGSERIVKELPTNPSLLVTVDCSDIGRLGFPSQRLSRTPDINIDHHPTNTLFAAVNLVRVEAAASAELLFNLSNELGLRVTQAVARNLLAGLVSDTIGFRTSSVTANTLLTAARLVDLGMPLAEIYEQVLGRHSYVAARYWGRGLSNLKQENGMVWTSLTQADREASGYTGLDDADLINILSAVEGIQVAVLFIEQPGGKVKVSWRSLRGLNVAELAGKFGGGGHDAAAGAMVAGDLGVVTSQVLSATQEQLQVVGEGKGQDARSDRR